MRKLLYSLVFASVLVLAGFTSYAADGPGEGGYALWLPMVEKTDRPETCNYSIQWDTTEPYVVKLGEPVTVAFRWKYDGGGYNDPWWALQAFNSLNPNSWSHHYLFANRDHDGLNSASESFVIQPEDGPSQPGEYQWWLRADCTINNSTVPVSGPFANLVVVYE